MKRHDPRKTGKAIGAAIKRFAKAANEHERSSRLMRKASERALQTFGHHGLTGSAATSLLKSICEAVPECTRCHARGHEMSGAICLNCAIELRNEAQH